MHITVSAVKVAERPSFGGKSCSHCYLNITICNFNYFPFRFQGPDLGSDSTRFWSLLSLSVVRMIGLDSETNFPHLITDKLIF